MLLHMHVVWFECMTKYPEEEGIQQIKYTLIQVYVLLMGRN